MKRILKINAVCLIVAMVGVAVLTTDAEAQGFTTGQSSGRGGNWEFLLPLTYSPSTSWDGQHGTSVDLDPTIGLGLGFGYNINDNFQINGLFNWSARNYNAKIVDVGTGLPNRYSNTLYSSTFSLNGVFYFLKGNITPFVSGGVGLTYIDTNIQTGSTSCWWDPWYYTYVCSSNTKTETDVSYNAGIGVRFDMDRKFSLQGSYNKIWIDFRNAAGGAPDFDMWRLDFIFRM